MAQAIETLGESFGIKVRRRIFGPEWAMEGTARMAMGFDEFLALTREARAGNVTGQMTIRETVPQEYDLEALFSSWRGRDANMVVYNQTFAERIVEGLDSEQGRNLQARLVRTVFDQLDRTRRILPRIRGRVSLSIGYLDRAPEQDLDVDVRAQFLAQRPWLKPLTPRSPQI